MDVDAKAALKSDPAASSESAKSLIPERVRALLGKPALLRSEHQDAYLRFFASIAVEFDPKTDMDWLLVGDYANQRWEGLRLRRIKSELINSKVSSAAVLLLGPLIDTMRDKLGLASRQGAEMLVRSALGGNAKDAKKLKKLLDAADISISTLEATAFASCMDEIEVIDKLQARNDRRCDSLKQELELRQAALTQRQRKVPDPSVTDVNSEQVV
jgi:hypothetical protein